MLTSTADVANHYSTAVLIAGAGGYGREVADLLAEAGRPVFGALDDGSPDLDHLTECGLALLGTIDDARDLATEAQREHGVHEVSYIVGVGYSKPRASIARRLDTLGLCPAAPVVHPTASVARTTEIGAGSVVMANATMSRRVVAGRHLLVNYNASVGHDVRLGSSVTIGPNAAIGGETALGDTVLIGSGAVVLQGITIGDSAIVGSGAVVTSDVAPGVTVVGVPAQPLR